MQDGGRQQCSGWCSRQAAQAGHAWQGLGQAARWHSPGLCPEDTHNHWRAELASVAWSALRHLKSLSAALQAKFTTANVQLILSKYVPAPLIRAAHCVPQAPALVCVGSSCFKA